MSQALADALKAQCAEQRERCLYTSTTLLIWLRCLRKVRIGFVIVPIVFGALASWDLLKGDDRFAVVTAALCVDGWVGPRHIRGAETRRAHANCGAPRRRIQEFGKLYSLTSSVWVPSSHSMLSRLSTRKPAHDWKQQMQSCTQHPNGVLRGRARRLTVETMSSRVCRPNVQCGGSSSARARPTAAVARPTRVKMKNPACAAVRREAEEDWGR